jgi:hypothetical protein
MAVGVLTCTENYLCAEGVPGYVYEMWRAIVGWGKLTLLCSGLAVTYRSVNQQSFQAAKSSNLIAAINHYERSFGALHVSNIFES